MDRGLSLRTHLWLAGCCFILSASGCLLAALRFGLPWWALATSLSVLVGAVIGGLEQAIAGPIERLARACARRGDHALPAPDGLLAAREVRRMWRGLRQAQELLGQARQAQHAAESRGDRLQMQATLLADAARTLGPDAALDTAAPALMAALATLLGLEAVYLVPLRRHCPIGVLGPTGEPAWGAALRASGFAPWNALFDAGQPTAIALTDLAPDWRRHWGRSTLWIVPLLYHGKPQGLLLAPAGALDRTWAPEEAALLQALAPLLASALHQPHWRDEPDGVVPATAPAASSERASRRRANRQEARA